MYLVELRPGKEELYRSVEELAAAIRSGDVDAHSRIFHRATSKWISITLHPQFRAIAAARESEPAPASRKEWTFLTSAADELDSSESVSGPAPLTVSDASTTPPAPEPVSEAPLTPRLVEERTRSWRRSFMFGAAGLLFIVGATAAFSLPRSQWPELGDAVSSILHEVQRFAGGSSGPVDSPAVSVGSTPAHWTAVAYPLPESIPARAEPEPVIIPPAPAIGVLAVEVPVAARE